MKVILALSLLITVSCRQNKAEEVDYTSAGDTLRIAAKQGAAENESQQIQTGNTTPQEVIDFAKTFIGTPYKYGSTDPAQGFDCSGFITCVFNHFNIAVPRTSAGFTNVAKEIRPEEAKAGDIILFTGTDSAVRIVGHMGIIISPYDKGIQFIHSTSGKANGVTITPFNGYYSGRFVKVIRVFRQNNN